MTSKLHPDTVDIEASGIGSESYPIEVGVVLSTGARYCTLVKPHESWDHWSDSAERLHGISRKLLAERGKTVDQVCHELNEFIGGKTIFSDNIDSDKPWLRKLFLTAVVKPKFQLYGIERILIPDQVEFWNEARMEINRKFRLSRHRASNEAFIIQQTFIESRRLCLLAHQDDEDLTLPHHTASEPQTVQL